MKSLAELLLSFFGFFFSDLPDLLDGFCELPLVSLGLAPPIAAASCGAPEMAAARTMAVSSEVLRMIPPVLAAWFRSPSSLSLSWSPDAMSLFPVRGSRWDGCSGGYHREPSISSASGL